MPPHHQFEHIDPAVEHFLDVFGGEVVIIEPPSEGDDAVTAPTKITLDQSRSPAHLSSLWNADLAVQLGPASGNLCAIFFAASEVLNKFLTRNAGLNTLITEHPDGFRAWLHVQGFTPRTQALPGMVWHADGYVRVFHRESPEDGCTVLRSGPPTVTKFLAINWPREAILPLLPEAAAHRFGERFVTHRGKTAPNLLFWTYLYTLFSKLRYVSTDQCFYKPIGAAKEWTRQTDEEVLGNFAEWVVAIPDSRTDGRLMSMIQPAGSRQVLNSIRMVAAGDLPPEADHVGQFLSRCVEWAPGSNCTTAELYQAFCEFCIHQSIFPMPASIFERAIPALLKQRFGVQRRHSIVREETSRRGFSHLRLKAVAHGTVGTMGTVDEPINFTAAVQAG